MDFDVVLNIGQKGNIFMMHQYKPELGIYLAEQALKMKYSDTREKQQQRTELKNFCELNSENHNMFVQYLRLQKIEINHIIIDTVLQSLPEEKRLFIEYKYKNNETFMKISMKLSVSTAQLNIWNKSVMEEIQDFMFYRITKHDAFCRKKIINMIEIMSKIILPFEENNLKQFVDTHWLKAVIYWREQYWKLLNVINDYLVQKNESVHNMVIATKLEHPNDSVTELADLCYVSPSIVSRHVTKFIHEVKPYLNE